MLIFFPLAWNIFIARDQNVEILHHGARQWDIVVKHISY